MSQNWFWLDSWPFHHVSLIISLCHLCLHWYNYYTRFVVHVIDCSTIHSSKLSSWLREGHLRIWHHRKWRDKNDFRRKQSDSLPLPSSSSLLLIILIRHNECSTYEPWRIRLRNTNSTIFLYVTHSGLETMKTNNYPRVRTNIKISILEHSTIFAYGSF